MRATVDRTRLERFERELLTEAELRAVFETVEPEMIRYPRLEPAAIRARLDAVVGDA